MTEVVDPTAEINPIAMLSIADHYVRQKVNIEKLQNVAQNDPVAIGLVAGKHLGTKIIISAAFPLFSRDSVDKNNSPGWLNESALKQRIDLVNEVHPGITILGWYSTREIEAETEKAINSLFAKFIEHPMLVRFDADKFLSNKDDSGNLSLSVLEYKPHSDTRRRIDFKFEGETSELISLDHIQAHSTSSDTSRTVSAKNVASLIASLEDFLKRIRACKNYVHDVQAAALTPDKDILSGIYKLCLRFKAIHQQAHGDASDDATNLESTKQVLLGSSLAALFGDLQTVAEMTNSRVYSDAGVGRRI